MASINYPVMDSKNAFGTAMITPAVLCTDSISCPVPVITIMLAAIAITAHLYKVDFIYYVSYFTII
jgi:hypothetical protein